MLIPLSDNHSECYMTCVLELSLKAVAHWALKGLTILYQIGTKSVPKSVGSFFRAGEHGKCQIYTLNLEKCIDFVLFWSHTQIDKKKQSVVL